MTTTSWTDYKLPFGAFRGKTVEEIPSRYLRWIINKIDERKYPKAVEAADKELAFRDEHNSHWED